MKGSQKKSKREEACLIPKLVIMNNGIVGQWPPEPVFSDPKSHKSGIIALSAKENVSANNS